MTTRTPARPDPAAARNADLFRSDAVLVESKLKRNDALQLVIEAKAAGWPVPESLEAATMDASLFATVYLPQASAAVTVAAEDLTSAKNADSDARTLRRALSDPDKTVLAITKVKLGADKVQKTEAKLSEAERLLTAVRREERAARLRYHAELRRPEVVAVWAECWRDLSVDEDALQDLTLRQANEIRTAAAKGRPLLQALYMLSLESPTQKDRNRLKELFAASPVEMPTIQTVREEGRDSEGLTPEQAEAKASAEAKAQERAANVAAASQAAASRMVRSDATTK